MTGKRRSLAEDLTDQGKWQLTHGERGFNMTRKQYAMVRRLYNDLRLCLSEMGRDESILADCVRYCKEHETDNDHRRAKLIVVNQLLEGINQSWRHEDQMSKVTVDYLCSQSYGKQLAYLLGYKIGIEYEPFVEMDDAKLCLKDKSRSFFVDSALETFGSWKCLTKGKQQ